MTPAKTTTPSPSSVPTLTLRECASLESLSRPAPRHNPTVARADHSRAAVLEDLHEQEERILIVVDSEDLVFREVVLP